MPLIQHFGWIPDLPDARDRRFVASRPPYDPTQLPENVDLRPMQSPFWPVYNQLKLGSCTANAIAGLLEFNHIKQLEPNAEPSSRLFIYYNERKMEGTVNSDSGAMIRDGIKSVVKQGAPPESLWPYDIDKFTEKPSAAAYEAARNHQALVYERIRRYTNIDNLRFALSQGFPFTFGFSVYDNFEYGQFLIDWVLHPPNFSRDGLLGGHAVVAAGYDHAKRRILVRNSWGSGWGFSGYFWMDYDYITDPSLCDDFWVISKVE